MKDKKLEALQKQEEILNNLSLASLGVASIQELAVYLRDKKELGTAYKQKLEQIDRDIVKEEKQKADAEAECDKLQKQLEK